MVRRRLATAVFLLAGGIAGGWVVTDSPGPAQTVRVEAPVSTEPPPAPLRQEDLIRQATASLAGQSLCEAPPEEPTEAQKRILDEIMSKAPPPTVPGDAPGGVLNIHRRVVPC